MPTNERGPTYDDIRREYFELFGRPYPDQPGYYVYSHSKGFPIRVRRKPGTDQRCRYRFYTWRCRECYRRCSPRFEWKVFDHGRHCLDDGEFEREPNCHVCGARIFCHSYRSSYCISCDILGIRGLDGVY